VKLLTEEDGLHRLVLDELAAVAPEWGSVPLEDLSLWCGDEPVPFLLEVEAGEGERLGAGSAIVFWADRVRGPDGGEHPYAERNVYWLAWDRGPGLRFRPRSAAPDGSAELAVGRDSVRIEEDREIVLHAPDYEWVWATLRGRDEFEAGFSLPAPAGGAGLEAELEVRIYRQTRQPVDPDHHWSLELNGHELLDRREDGDGESLVRVVFPNAWFAESNVLRLVNHADTEAGEIDIISLDYVALAFWRRLETAGGVLAFSGAPGGAGDRVTYRCRGSFGPEATVLELSRAWVFSDVGWEPRGGVGEVLFADGARGGRRYVVFDPAVELPAPELERPAPGGELFVSEGAEYLVITHPRFAEAAEAFAEFRRSQGWPALAVDVEAIYDAFGYGLPSGEAIREFLGYAVEQWPRRPRFVTLLGDETSIRGGTWPAPPRRATSPRRGSFRRSTWPWPPAAGTISSRTWPWRGCRCTRRSRRSTIWPS
jgi:hypothetical protein